MCRCGRCVVYTDPRSTIPRSSSLMSLAAWIPSSLSAFSITLLRSRACRSSALIEHPIVLIGLRTFACRRRLDERHSTEHVGRHARIDRRPTRDPSTSQIDSESYRSYAVRRSDFSSRLVLILSQIHQILFHTDSNYANVTSNMRQACLGSSTATAPAYAMHCAAAAAARRSLAAAAAGNSGGRMTASPAGEQIVDSDPQK